MDDKKYSNQYIKNFLKYIIIGLIVGISCRYIPTTTINTTESLMIAFIASFSFSTLDMISPHIKN